MHIQIFVESQFCNASFLLGPLLKYAGLQKIVFWASVRDSGFQRMHIQISGESQFYNAPFLLGLLLKYADLRKIVCWTFLWIQDFSQRGGGLATSHKKSVPRADWPPGWGWVTTKLSWALCPLQLGGGWAPGC